MIEDLYVVGSAWLPLEEDSDLQLDEAVFEACTAAIRSAGVKRHQIDYSVVSSLDLYDGRSISNALTAPAAAGYLNDEIRIEGDASMAFLTGLAGLASGQSDMVIVVASHSPEVSSTGEREIRRLREKVSSYTFDSHFDRPVAMTSNATLGMHAGLRLDSGELSFDDLAQATASEISRGATGRGRRSAVTAQQVADSPQATTPLTELMLPAESAGIAAVIISAGVLGRRCAHPLARVVGWGTATGPSSSNADWLNKPTAPAQRAAELAFSRAGLSGADIDAAEITDLSPALTDELLRALALNDADTRVNASGGVRSNHPGLANGLLRIIEGGETIQADQAERFLVHAADDLQGLVSATHAVLVMAAP